MAIALALCTYNLLIAESFSTCHSRTLPRKVKLTRNVASSQLNMVATIPGALSGMSAVIPTSLKLPMTFKYWAAAPVMYALMSMNEYITHRYYQHAEFNKNALMQKLFRGLQIDGGGHVEHHAETLDDMSLKTDERWLRTPAAQRLNSDPFRGTAFTWSVTLMMFTQMLFTTIPVFKYLLGFSLKTTLAMLAPALLLHATAWNTLHPAMHYLSDVPASIGPASKWLAAFKDSWIFKFLYQNHEGHHVLGGLANYNVCCPGTDHMLGTYVPEKEWRPKMKAVAEDRMTNKDPSFKKYAIA